MMSTLLARMFCHDLVCGLTFGEKEKKDKGKDFAKHIRSNFVLLAAVLVFLSCISGCHIDMQESKTDQTTNSSPTGQEGQSSENEKRLNSETSSSLSVTTQTQQTQVCTLKK